MTTKIETFTPIVRPEDIMSKPLIFAHTSDSVRQVAATMLDKNISGLPALDNLDRPVGVITKTDVVRYEREFIAVHEPVEGRRAMRARGTLELVAEGGGFHRETEEDTVQHWMTPKIFTVSAGAKASLADVIREMLARHVHRLFVQEENTKRLVGVITTFDLLKFLARVFLVEQTEDLKSAIKQNSKRSMV